MREGSITEDPYDDLMASRPEEVYAMFGSGAYSWEFGLDTMDKAARFVEDYHRATGFILDLPKAFGESGRAVATAMLRRSVKPDPIMLGRQLQDSYDIAVRDMDSLAEAMGDRLVFETMRSAGLPTVRMARGISWPEWVAYCATACEAGVTTGPLSGKWSPLHSPRPDPLHEFDGVERIFFTFFHPQGPCYVDDKGTEHEGICEEVASWLSAADRDVDLDYVVDLTERMMHWCEITDRNASLSRTYLEAWSAGDWKTIAESLPLSSPYRGEIIRYASDPQLAIEPPEHAGQPSTPAQVAKDIEVLPMMVGGERPTSGPVHCQCRRLRELSPRALRHRPHRHRSAGRARGRLDGRQPLREARPGRRAGATSATTSSSTIASPT